MNWKWKGNKRKRRSVKRVSILCDFLLSLLINCMTHFFTYDYLKYHDENKVINQNLNTIPNRYWGWSGIVKINRITSIWSTLTRFPGGGLWRKVSTRFHSRLTVYHQGFWQKVRFYLRACQRPVELFFSFHQLWLCTLSITAWQFQVHWLLPRKVACTSVPCQQ